MMDETPDNHVNRSTGIACTVLLTGVLLGPLPLHAAAPPAGAAQVLKTQTDGLGDLAVLAKNRPRKCADDQAAEAAVRGWRMSAAQCAWQNRLQMRRWETERNGASTTCLSDPARWWAWARFRAGPAAWNGAWSAQSLLDEAGAQKRVVLIERIASGSWVATEWRWAPPSRMATRQWELSRWQLLVDAAARLRQTAHGDSLSAEAARMSAAWMKNLNGRAGEISADHLWRWERDGLCLRMEEVGLSQAQLQLPYSQEDGRLEQRAAMQLRLARLHPKAAWVTPFRLLPMPNPALRSGAKYEAIWVEDGTVKGQLWMPAKNDGRVLRARIAVTLPGKRGTQADAAMAGGIARAIDGELIGLATAWALDNEQ